MSTLGISYDKRCIHHEEAKAQTKEWVSYYKLMDVEGNKYKNSDYTLLPTLVYPTADLVGLRLLSDFITWLFIFDDKYEIDRDIHFLIEFSENGSIQDNDNQKSNIVTSYIDWHDRFKQVASDNCVKRFDRNIVSYFTELKSEMNMRRKESIPDVEEYKRARRETGAVKPTFDLIQVSRKISYLEEDNIFISVTDLANDYISWFNDLVSYERELKNGETYNFIFVLEKHKGMTRERAIETLKSYTDDTLRKFKNICDLNKEHIQENNNLNEYILGLEDWMMGHTEWCKITKRYKE